MARVLSVFAISPMTDSEGREVKPDIKFVTNTSRFATFNHSSASICLTSPDSSLSTATQSRFRVISSLVTRRLAN